MSLEASKQDPAVNSGLSTNTNPIDRYRETASARVSLRANEIHKRRRHTTTA